MQFSKTAAFMAFVTSVTAAAVPEANPAAGVAVYIRGEDFAYTLSEEHTARVRRELEESPLQKRSHATVQQCYQAGCGDCHTVFDGNYDGFTCLDASNTACLIVSNLDDGQINYWNHAGCNHRESTYHGCGKPPTNVNAPGTNSIGIQVGC